MYYLVKARVVAYSVHRGIRPSYIIIKKILFSINNHREGGCRQGVAKGGVEGCGTPPPPSTLCASARNDFCQAKEAISCNLLVIIAT